MTDRPAKTAKSQRTKAAILKAAQELFADPGYERATVRDIAARAAIDPAMVIRYFGSKEGLFARATAFDLKLPNLTVIAKPHIGRTLIAHFLEVWEGSLSNGSLISLLRAAASNESAAAAGRTIFGGRATNFRPASSHGVPSSLDIEPTLRLGAASSATTAAPRRERPLLFGRVRYWCPTSALPITERY